MAKGGSGKVFFCFRFLLLLSVQGRRRPFSPSPDNVGNVVLGGCGKKRQRNKSVGFHHVADLFPTGRNIGAITEFSPLPPPSFPSFFSSFSRYCAMCIIVVMAEHDIVVVASKSVLVPRLGSRCVRLLATLFAAGGRHFGSIGGFSQKCTIASAVCLSWGGERGVSNILAPCERPNFAKQTDRPLPDGCSPVMHFALTPNPPTLAQHSGKL